MSKHWYYFKPDGTRVRSGPNNLVREDGRIEQLCKHGVGHPVGHWKENGWDKSWMGSHGCDGCCYKAEFALEALENAGKRKGS